MKSWMIAVVAAVVLVVGGGAFYGGMKFGENRLMQDPSKLFQQMVGQRGMAGATGQQGAFQVPNGMTLGGRADGTTAGQTALRANGTLGTIEAVEGNMLTLRTNDGSIQVQTSDTTLIEKYSSVNVSDLEMGESILVSGSTNDDGSITARSIQSMRGAPTATGGE